MIAKRSSKRKEKWEKIQNIFFVSIFLLVILGIIGFFIYNNFSINSRRSDLEQRKQELQAQLLELQLRQGDLEVKIEYNDSEEFQEKILREQGLFQKPGEEVITILPPDEKEEIDKGEKERVWWNPITWF
ncbi:MAG: septum formation initiator family protein [Patescibacteria group bacterium]|nr:septum formation initiator family protein [Patescibacteria group bacterium]